MKKKTLLYLFLCAIFVAALFKGGRQSTGVPAAGTAFLLPNSTPVTSDLDARDGQNRPIPTPFAEQQLQTLFRENLLNLSVFATPHSVTQVLDWIDSISHLLNKSILCRCSVLFKLVLDVFFPPSRRVVHNVDKLCITFSVGTFAAFLLLTTFSLQRKPLTVNPRC